jgi:hypothetical protein
MYVHENDITIQGIVVGVRRRYYRADAATDDGATK